MNYNIACGIDDNYVQHAAVMLMSLSLTNKYNSFDVYVLSLGVKEESKRKLQDVFYKSNLHIYFIDIKESVLVKFPIRKKDYLSLATYLRLFMPDKLPDNINKILYLDSDIIINGDIAPLFNTDVTGKYAAACLDVDQDNCLRLNYDKRLGYYNAGVFLFNIYEMRKIKFMEFVRDYVENVNAPLKYHDQDVLNFLFKGKIVSVNHKWNLLECYYLKKELHDLYDDIDDAIEHPMIIHYSSSFRPWNFGCNHPLKSKYFFYLDMIPWGNKTLHRFVAFKRLRLWAKIIILLGGSPTTKDRIKEFMYGLIHS